MLVFHVKRREMALMMRVRATISGLPGSPYLMTTYWTGNPEDSSAANVASNAMQAFLNALKPGMSVALLWAIQSDIAVMNASDGEVTALLSGPVANTGVGGDSAPMTPTAVQGHLVLRTATVHRGRLVHGGINIPGVTTTSVNQGQPTTTFLTRLATASAELLSPVLADLVVWARPTRPPLPAAPGVPALVEAINVTQKFAVLRSRRD